MNKNKVLLYSTLILLFITAAASLFRFAVMQDYIAAFEGDCDPYTESCYVDCEDEECTSEYYYTVIERMAHELRDLCGTDDVSECDEAYECQTNVEFCEVSYCDPEVDGEDYCEYLEEGDRPTEEELDDEPAFAPVAEDAIQDEPLSTSTTEALNPDQESTSDDLETESFNSQEL